MEDKIKIKGAREHNLKDVHLEIPKHKLTVFTGLSGSGKSSLAFDTIFAEGQRRYVESLSAYARQFLGQMAKPDVDEITGLSPAISIDQKAHSANPRSIVATITEIYDYLRVLYARIGQPHCVTCDKPISKLSTDEMIALIMKKNGKEKRDGKLITILAPVIRGRKGEYLQLLNDLYTAGFIKVRLDGELVSLKEQVRLSRFKKHTIELVVDQISAKVLAKGLDADRQRLAEALETALQYGQDTIIVQYPDKSEALFSAKFACPDDGFSFPEIEPRLFSFNSPYGYCEYCTGLGTEELFSEEICPECRGARLRKEGLAVRIAGKSIVDVTSLSIEEALKYFMDLIPSTTSSRTSQLSSRTSELSSRAKSRDPSSKHALSETEYEIAKNVLREIVDRTSFMLDVGLHYLTLNRKAGTLSGGEAQRIRLASQIGSKLTGTLYVLDEPTIGLHQRDNERLIKTLQELRDLGNTIIVVEHDEETIHASDFMADIGPGAGKHGGEVVIAGETKKLLKSANKEKSLTLDYLQGKKSIPIPERRRYKNLDVIKVIGAHANNLKNIDVEIPLRRLVCVTGVSGSGKSTLVNHTLHKTLLNRLRHLNKKVGDVKAVLGTEYIDKIARVSQSAIGRTPRSNPVTYTGAFTHIRELFALTADSRMRGWKPGRFSFNVKRERGGGRCPNCEGNGFLAIEMHFLPTVYVTCDVCHGKRFDHETLAVKYNKKSIADVLEMTIEEAAVFFKDVPAVADKMKVLNEVGLGYLTLGQSARTLSGGEAQRVKLATHLSKRDTRKTLFILDEPTVGLHYEDVRKLIDVLQKLVDRGNTVLVIEHNLEVIKCADWIIDLGPEGGDKGGEVIATGTPEEVSKKAGSYTGKYLKKVLKD
ncbi:MAG: excinuclease ABC subunit A [Parcubacteria group bacterium]|nr:excinuclease ABC subunit A [Parcubacteria group bacterium]